MSNERTLQTLQAYHDGELGRLRRWWMERRLRSSPELRGELAELQELGGLLRQLDLRENEGETPELWTSISAGLSRIDRQDDRVLASEERPRFEGFGLTWRPVAATAMAAALALALLLDFESPIRENATVGTPEVVASGALRYLKTDGRPFVVSQDRDDVTIIWLMDAPGEA